MRCRKQCAEKSAKEEESNCKQASQQLARPRHINRARARSRVSSLFCQQNAPSPHSKSASLHRLQAINIMQRCTKQQNRLTLKQNPNDPRQAPLELDAPLPLGEENEPLDARGLFSSTSTAAGSLSATGSWEAALLPDRTEGAGIALRLALRAAVSAPPRVFVPVWRRCCSTTATCLPPLRRSRVTARCTSGAARRR